ncbi:MAG: hypothetical protein ACOYMB_04450 [Patescibacteria group bacterium]
MENKTTISQLTYEDLAEISENNTAIICETLLSRQSSLPGTMQQEIYKEFMKELVAEMQLSIQSLAPLCQSNPTRFHLLFTEEMIRGSEKIKRARAKKMMYTDYDVELDIRETRKQIEAQLAANYKTELTLEALMRNQQYDQALTIVYALELERASKDAALRLEVMNWELEILSAIGNEQKFFLTLQKMINLPEVANSEMKYDRRCGNNLITNLLHHKLTNGIPIQFNHFGMQSAQKDSSFPQKIGKEFTDLLSSKVSEAILEKRTITSAKDFNDFLNNEWSNIVASFKLINPYVENVIMIKKS